MKIAYVITRGDAVGGASIHVRDLAAGMKARGHEVCVFVGGSGAVVEQMRVAGVPVASLAHLRRAIDPWRDIRAYAELKEALREYRPDLVSTHTAKAGWLGRASARALRIPAIYTPHGWSISDRISAMQGIVYTAAERIAAPWADAIVCVSESERQLALEKRVGRPGRLHVIHNGVREVGESLRALAGESPPHIVSVARFESPKDHATLVEALAQIQDLDWTAEFVGEGPLEAVVRAQVEEAGLSRRVRFSGYLPDPAPVLARAQIFVLSSRSEGFPRSVLEAMRAGLPVVASDVGGIREAVEETLAPPGSARALASALRRLAQDAALRVALGRAARMRYQERFRFERMLEQTAALYERVLRRQDGR